MDLFLSSVFVLSVPLLVFFYPVLVFFLAYSFYKKVLIKNKTWTFIFRFFLGYMAFSLFAVLLYLMISYMNGISAATSTRTDIIYTFTATAALAAPIAVFLGFNLWKKQHFLTLKIQVIGNLKATLVDQLEILNEFWKTDSVRKMRLAVDIQTRIEFRQGYENMISKFEEERTKIRHILEKDGFYIGIDSSDLKKLMEFNENSASIVDALDIAFDQLKSFFWDGNQFNSQSEYYEKLYLLSHNGALIKNYITNKSVSEAELINKKNELIIKKINDHYIYLNNMLKEIYAD